MAERRLTSPLAHKIVSRQSFGENTRRDLQVLNPSWEESVYSKRRTFRRMDDGNCVDAYRDRSSVFRNCSGYFFLGRMRIGVPENPYSSRSWCSR